jgi:hypothetical protein
MSRFQRSRVCINALSRQYVSFGGVEARPCGLRLVRSLVDGDEVSRSNLATVWLISAEYSVL